MNKRVKKQLKPRNPIAMDLATPKYHQRVVPNKKKLQKTDWMREFYYECK